MIYSKQKIFCNCCGLEMFEEIPRVMGGQYFGFKICSKKCAKEMRWRETLSIMNKEYYPDPSPYKENA